MEASYLQRHPLIKDIFGIFIFILCVLVGTLLINSYVFRSFSVVGQSMEHTFSTNDRVIVNRLPVTLAQIENKAYVPERGQIIVFKNPKYDFMRGEEFVIKRVVAFPGERVTVKDGIVTVYNTAYPEGFQPDTTLFHGEPLSPTSGDVDTTVIDSTLFVMGDNRIADNSCDSRSCLGSIPYYDVVGPVGLRIFPIDKIRTF
jgi:signal peptidase I